MAYSVDIEDVTWKIIDVLGDGMVAKLNTIDTAKSDDITLDDIEKFYFGDQEFNPSLQNLPAIIVKGRGFVPTAIATNNQYRDNPIRIEIECYVGSNANETFTKDGRTYDFGTWMEVRIMRYARAIVELLTENGQLSSNVSLLNFTDVLLSNVIDIDGTIIKACRVEVDYLGAINSLG